MSSVFELISDLIATEETRESPSAKKSGQEHSKVQTITPEIPKPSSEHSVQIAMERACIGLNILPSEFRALIEDDEAQHIATGRIPVKSARAYARLFAGELARNPHHPVNLGMSTCWACKHYRGKKCSQGRFTNADRWFRCDAYR